MPALLLLVACANVANLTLVRADARQRELSVREALGAGRGRIALHFVTEPALVAAVASLMGLLLAAAAVRGFVSAGPAGVPRLAEVRIDATTVLFTLVVAVFVVIACGLVPAIRAARSALALREGGRSGTAGRRQHRLRGGLVAAQIALALVALSGAGLLARTFQRLNAIHPGWNPEHVSTFWLSLFR